MNNHFNQNQPEPDKTGIPVLVVSRPGIMRQSLRATLITYPGIKVVASAGDGLTALNYTLRHKPALLVVDSNLLEEEVEALLLAVKDNLPQTRCLICVQSHQGQARLLAAGADAVIPRNGWAQLWQETLLRLTQKRV